MLFQSPFIHEALSSDLKEAIGCLGYLPFLGFHLSLSIVFPAPQADIFPKAKLLDA